jgi:cobalt/nickel transport protein
MKKITLIGLFIAIILAFFFSPFASKSPDGLEKVAEKKEFLHKCEDQKVFKAPFLDYLVPGIKNERIATGVAGLIGTLISFGLAFGWGYLVRKREKR